MSTAEAVEETAPEEIDSFDAGQATAFLSLDAIIFLPFAILLDLIGIVLICFALDDFWITDILGIIFIGGWTYFRSGTVKVTRSAGEKIKRSVGKMAKWVRRLKWLRPLLIFLEFIPYVGVLPSWTVLVYLELKYS